MCCSVTKQITSLCVKHDLRHLLLLDPITGSQEGKQQKKETKSMTFKTSGKNILQMLESALWDARVFTAGSVSGFHQKGEGLGQTWGENKRIFFFFILHLENKDKLLREKSKRMWNNQSNSNTYFLIHSLYSLVPSANVEEVSTAISHQGQRKMLWLHLWGSCHVVHLYLVSSHETQWTIWLCFQNTVKNVPLL